MEKVRSIKGCRVSTTQAAQIAGIRSFRTLDSWIRTDLVTVAKPARGKGHRRELSFVDLVRIRTVKLLRDKGVSLQAIRKALQVLAEHDIEDPLAQSGRLLVVGGRVWWEKNTETLLDILKEQLAFKPLVILEMGEVTREIKQALEKIA